MGEAECSMISPAVSTFSTPSLDFCIAVCATTGLSNPNTYASWDSHLHECNCFETGARRCQMEIVKAGFSMTRYKTVPTRASERPSSSTDLFFLSRYNYEYI